MPAWLSDPSNSYYLERAFVAANCKAITRCGYASIVIMNFAAVGSVPAGRDRDQPGR
jgi:hypothetical protein